MEPITVNGEPLEKTRYVVDTLGRSAVRVPRSVRLRGSDGGASKARHNPEDELIMRDPRWSA